MWSQRRRLLVERFVATAAQRLRLADWTITVDFETPAADGTLAEVALAEGQKRAVIWLGPAFLAASGPDQRHTLVHELVHCHLADLQHTAAQVAAHLRGSSERALATDLLNTRVEWATDALADALVVLTADLPVPADASPAGASVLTETRAVTAAKAATGR